MGGDLAAIQTVSSRNIGCQGTVRKKQYDWTDLGLGWSVHVRTGLTTVKNVRVAAALASSVDWRIMRYKKPTPILGERNRKICPVCGKRSYSAGGIHPQCAAQQADAPREQQLKAKKEAEAKKKKKKLLTKKPRQKKCPKCGVGQPIRKKKCDCGFDFFKS